MKHQDLIIALLSCLGLLSLSAKADIVISEVAYAGSGEATCAGADWVELLNTGDDDVDLTNYILHDDKGEDDEDALVFTDVVISSGEYLLLCRNEDFAFGIGSDDTVSLVGPTGIPVSSVGLTGKGAEDGTATFALDGGEYVYTATPTPGEANIISAPPSREESLIAKNEEGADFFDLNGSFGQVVDIHLTMEEEGRAVLQDHPEWQEWAPFVELSISDATDNSTMIASSGTGEIRVKGQSTGFNTPCMGSKATPFSVRFDASFLGLDNIYLRSHFNDFSFMREHSAHKMLKASGLPYLRSRPGRVYINGEYIGFFTILEAPDQDYVMQRSFPGHDPEKTALFKMKTSIQYCPNPPALATIEPTFDPDAPPPEFYEFERGRHREPIPVLGDFASCSAAFGAVIGPRLDDAARGYLAYGRDCGLSMVEIGRVDLKLGPETMKEPMINWLNSKFYNVTDPTFEGTIDMDQWIKNFAIYSVLGSRDTVISQINNWYLATTEGGNDWKIVQWDHNTISYSIEAGICGVTDCMFRSSTWPILQPGCGRNDVHAILSKTLNTEENIQKYLDYTKEFVDLLTTSGIIEEMIEYGNIIKEYAAADPFFYYPQDPLTMAGYSSLEAYEERELSGNIEYYKDISASPFIPTLLNRLNEVSMQLDAIEAGTLPRDGSYDAATICPDWRDQNFVDYIPGFLLQQPDPSQILVESESCPPELATGLCDPLALSFAACYAHGTGCDLEGEFTFIECEDFELNVCAPCFPYSRCGGNVAPPDELIPLAPHGESVADGMIVLDTDGVLGVAVENTCEACLEYYFCFDHAIGCFEDGTVNPIYFQCPAVMVPCSGCFPNSRCAVSGDTTPVADDSGMFVEGESCGPELASCADAAPCFDHAQGCAEDGSMIFEDCAAAVPFCEPCFPFSRCGGDGGAPVAVDESATFVEGENCGPELALCADAGPCFDNTIGCAEDGTMAIEECEAALPFCAPCFPLSRCGSAGGEEVVEETPEETPTPPAPPVETPVESGARHSLVSGMFSIVVAGLSWLWMVV